jgi:hypothetical protein
MQVGDDRSSHRVILAGTRLAPGGGSTLSGLPSFCRHNRYMAECPICSKGTVLDSSRPTRARRSGSTRRAAAAPPPTYKGPYAAAGPYEDDDGIYEVRLERVPGGLRLAEWAAGAIRRRAPVLAIADLPGLVREAAEQDAMTEADAATVLGALAAPEGGGPGVSRGRTGELRDELRVERLEDERVRVARWVLRGNYGWELQETPVMLPPARYVEAIADTALA